MNYRHSFHSGNLGDVCKHICLIALIKILLRKDTAFCVLDTHAGIGRYDLFSENAQKNKEYTFGIAKIWQQPDPPELVSQYLECIANLNPDPNLLRFYPGSPYIIRQFLRPQDRMILTELHPEDFQTLKKVFLRDKQIAIHHQDAYQGLKAFLPPKERRGLVLIDPPYEAMDELGQAIGILASAVQRWGTGIFALWYPIKDSRSLERFHQLVKEKISCPYLIAELCIYPEDTNTHLNGNGMLILNPPWKLDEELQKIFPWLWQKLNINQLGRHDIKMHNN